MALSSLGAVLKALGDLFADFHGRVIDFLAEADPRTTDELLAEWERVYGLPLCDDAPTGDDERRAALAGRVAAVGGQTPAYYIDLAWAVLEQTGYGRATDPDLVTIEETPYGEPFRVGDRVGGRLGSVTDLSHWILHLPADTSADLAAIIECLVERYAPAHTVVHFEYDTTP